MHVDAPIHVNVPTGFGDYSTSRSGTFEFWRPVTRTRHDDQCQHECEPGDAAHRHQCRSTKPARPAPGDRGAAATGRRRHPWVRPPVRAGVLPAAAEQRIAEEIAAYAQPLQFGL